MVDVSKLARARMAQAPVAGPHPDADLLTAFSERSLAAREREQVLAHLATCADCREVVALSAPAAAEQLEAVAPGTAKPRWLPWPVLRWGAVAAAVAVVAVAVIIEAPKRTSENATARQSAAVANDEKAFASAGKKVEQPSAATEQAAAADLRARADAAPKQAEVAKLEARKEAQEKKQNGARDEDRALAAVAAPPPPAMQAPQDRAAEADRFATGKATAAGGAATSAQLAGRTAGLAKMKDDKNTAAVAEEAAAQPATKPAPAPSASAESYTMARSAPATPAKTSSGNLSAYGAGYVGESAPSSAPAAMDSMHAQLKPAALRWTVTSDGRVQRSADGRVWTDVPVAKDVKFRALVANGDEVWAGGAHGALYYSANAGGNWRPQPVTQVNGDIIRLNVNGQTLVISTSSGQTIELSHEVFGDRPAKPPTSR